MSNKNKTVKVDTVSGSRAYNRLDMQVSQTLHMAIELYDSFDYLFILDHYDDITLFDLDSEPLAVSYYQMKTSEDTITIDSAISHDWLAKMHEHLNNPNDWFVKELGLITNTPLSVSYKVISNEGKSSNKKELLLANRTELTKLDLQVQNKIKADIAKKCGIPANQVDLSKFAHIHTTLTIEKHRDLVEKEVEDFLFDKYPQIKVDTVKGIYGTLIDILTKRQEYERLPDNTDLQEVKQHKGFTKTEFSRVINRAIMISMPTFEEVQKYANLSPEMLPILSLAYVNIMADSTRKSDKSFPVLFLETEQCINMIPFDGNCSLWEYGHKIGQIVHKKNPLFVNLYNLEYISVLIICMLINKLRSES